MTNSIINGIQDDIRNEEFVEMYGDFQTMDTDLLIKIATGKVDARYVAAAMLAGRGVDESGNWVKFSTALKIWSKVVS